MDTCPFEGRVDPVKVKDIAYQLKQMGCYEISLGDTVGTAVPLTVERLLDEVTKSVDISQLAVSRIYELKPHSLKSYIGPCMYSPSDLLLSSHDYTMF